MLKSSLCDYSNANILVKETITITGAGANAPAQRAGKGDKTVTLKDCAPFTRCISERNNTQVDNARDFGVVMQMYNPTEYSNNYAKKLESLWYYHKDVPSSPITDSESFKFKVTITGSTLTGGNTRYVKIAVP